MQARLALKLVALTVAGTSTATAAPSRERVATVAFAVPRDPSGQKAAAAIGAIVRERIKRAERLRLVSPGRVLSGDPRTREEELLDRARTALADGRRAYDALSLDDAIARLGQAVSLYQRTGPLLGDLDELRTALGYLGAALTLRGSADEGVSTFYELLTVDPSHTLDDFPPAVVKVFDRAVDRLNSAPTGSVEIYSTPPHAAVFLDGTFRGVTPLSMDSLTAGTHYLRLEKDGYILYGGPPEIPAKQRITSQTRLRTIKRGAELRDLLSRAVPEIAAEAMGGNLRELSRLLLTDSVIIIAVSQSGRDASLTGAVFDGRSATRLSIQRAVLPIEGPAFEKDIGELVDRLIASAAGGVATGETTASGDPSSGGAFGLSSGGGTPQQGAGGTTPSSSVQTRDMVADGSPKPVKVLGWALIGVGAAALINASVFAALAKSTHKDFLATPQNSPDLSRIQDDGKTKALVADISFGAAGAFAVGGAVTLIVHELTRPAAIEMLGKPQIAVIPLDGGLTVSVGGVLPLP